MIKSDDGKPCSRWPAAGGRYSFVLRYLGGNTFRRVMGPEPFLPQDWPGGHDASVPEQNLCPISCGRSDCPAYHNPAYHT